MEDLEKALGQYSLYSALLAEVEPDRTLFLAVSDSTYDTVFATAAGQVVVGRLSLRIIVINLGQEEVVRWIE
jgi:hypothetical protein